MIDPAAYEAYGSRSIYLRSMDECSEYFKPELQLDSGEDDDEDDEEITKPEPGDDSSSESDDEEFQDEGKGMSARLAWSLMYADP